MAQKTVYQPLTNEIGVKRTLIEYEYFSGFALAQKQKCISSLHKAAEKKGIKNILEISSKSPSPIGISLSAFNLSLKIDNTDFCVEQLFQASKVFERGGPYTDLLKVSSREAKRDQRLKESGNIIAFNIMGKDFSTEPKTLFYDWLYSNALLQNKNLLLKALEYNAFTDIEFNEKKSINCQAYSLALFCSIIKNNNKIIDSNNISKEEFFEICQKEYTIRWNSL